jgi:hypothetical protein
MCCSYLQIHTHPQTKFGWDIAGILHVFLVGEHVFLVGEDPEDSPVVVEE